MTSPFTDALQQCFRLHKTCDVGHPVAGQQHDRRYIDQCEAAVSHAGDGSCTGNQYLRGQRRVIDFHIEDQMLV